jgi:hypothetical protein
MTVVSLLLCATASAGTWRQTLLLPSGGTAVLTVSTSPITAATTSTAVSLGTVSGTHAAAAFAPLIQPLVAGGSGSAAMFGRVQYNNALSVNLWTYDEQVNWNYASYTVTSIYGQTAWSESSCCLWGFQGNTTVSHDPAGGANFTAFAQGRYQVCILWACTSDSPYVSLTGNGNGTQTGFDWGIG